MTTIKHAGASCPKCGAAFCAEYAQLGQAARWTCHGCGAGGDLLGDVSARKALPVPVVPEKRPPPWARNLGKG